MDKQERTPKLPLTTRKPSYRADHVIVDATDDNCVADVKKEYAEYIVRAVNSHDELLEACKDILDFLRQSGYDTRKVKQAIAAATAAAGPTGLTKGVQ